MYCHISRSFVLRRSFCYICAPTGGCTVDRRSHNWPRGPMDKASAYGAGDCRFESCRGHFISAEHTQIASRKHHMRSMMAAAIENSASTIREQNYKCRDPGSNRGPSDLQSDALPTELSRQVLKHCFASSHTAIAKQRERQQDISLRLRSMPALVSACAGHFEEVVICSSAC